MGLVRARFDRRREQQQQAAARALKGLEDRIEQEQGRVAHTTARLRASIEEAEQLRGLLEEKAAKEHSMQKSQRTSRRAIWMLVKEVQLRRKTVLLCSSFRGLANHMRMKRQRREEHRHQEVATEHTQKHTQLLEELVQCSSDRSEARADAARANERANRLAIQVKALEAELRDKEARHADEVYQLNHELSLRRQYETELRTNATVLQNMVNQAAASAIEGLDSGLRKEPD